jgi:2-keto-4-pentenoate hydratase/2-oxohepta-3-ene-1,7-dioic acid hydratase in catechol pathway
VSNCALKLAHYVKGDSARAGVITGEKLFDLNEAAQRHGHDSLGSVNTIDEILSRGLLDDAKNLAKKLENSNTGGVKLDSVRLRSPVLNPEKMYLAAVNYLSHSEEHKAQPPPYPYFFTKFRNALIGPEDPVIVPKVSKKVDWEVELAVIVGKRGKNIPKSDAMSYVAGYTIANDISFRDFQMNEYVSPKPPNLERNWVKGKGMDSSFPLGPCLVTVDEIQDPYSCRLSLYVNGQKRQDSIVGEMIYKIDELIEYLSAGITLLPGDVISTGTPMGVATFSGAPFLKQGDILEARINGIGVLRNPVQNEAVGY